MRPERTWVLYWMTSFRRLRYNFALDRAIELARALEKPLVILEGLRVAYPDANDRLHAFLLEGMGENARRAAGSPVLYVPYVEPSPGHGSGLLVALAQRACVVVGDDWPCYFIPRMQAAAARRLDVRFELVDSNGLFPLYATDRLFTTAQSFRLHLQKQLRPHLACAPRARPLDGLVLPGARLPRSIASRWPPPPAELLVPTSSALRRLPIDHRVPRAPLPGGSAAAERRLRLFLDEKLPAYAEARDEPEEDGTSRLSPYLHFGHLSVHHILAELARRERWEPVRLRGPRRGAKAGFWGMSAPSELFLDELVTWRELAFNAAAHRPRDYGTMAMLPRYARETLARHARDRRPHLYTRAELEGAQTHDPLWNAAQRQLLREGWFHGYLRMLWGKKILEWSPSPEEALRRMETLMNRHALDGRDPCSYSGYLWVLGRCDRAWGPERPIFGKVRYMSSENTARKVRVARYLETYGEAPAPRRAA